MNQHSRYQFSVEELFLRVYVLIDDWLKANEARFDLPRQARQVASYSELFTIAVVGELLAQPYESVWYWLVQQNHRDSFPRLPEYSRYHRVVRNAEKLWAELAFAFVAFAFVAADEGFRIIDAKPLPIAKGKRNEWAKLPEARKGFSTMGMVYGFKLHAVVNEQGRFERWSFTSANHHEAKVAPELLEGLEQEVIGDKAFIGIKQVITPSART